MAMFLSTEALAWKLFSQHWEEVICNTIQHNTSWYSSLWKCFLLVGLIIIYLCQLEESFRIPVSFPSFNSLIHSEFSFLRLIFYHILRFWFSNLIFLFPFKTIGKKRKYSIMDKRSPYFKKKAGKRKIQPRVVKTEE